MGRPTKLTPETHELIVKYIRGGMFDHVAAAACGVGASTFRLWKQRGEAGRHPYRAFLADVLHAKGFARGAAEARVYTENPYNWLRYGPGRDRPGEPGWTESSTVTMQGQPGEPIEVVIRYVRVAASDRPAGTTSVAGNGDRRGEPV